MGPLDPWLPARLRAEADLIRAEARIEKAVRLAIAAWLAEVRRLVLGPDETLTAAGLAVVDHARAHPTPTGRLEPEAITAAGMPNLEGFDGANIVWLRALREFLKPDLADLFGERFLALARIALISMQPYRDAYINQVFSRLRLFPAQEFENIRFEIAEGISEGEGIDLIRDRIAAQLDFDATRGAKGEQAASRAVQGRIDVIERALAADLKATSADDPANLSAAQIKSLRAERGALYREKRRLDQRWEFKARRIARTETIGAFNGGDYAGALAAEEQEGRTLWKQWLATDDERTRHSHVLADGQVRELRTPFIVGGWPLEHPGDPVGPGHEVINCRCTALYLDSDELAAEGIDPNDLPPPEGDPLVSPEEMAANAARNADRIGDMAGINAAASPTGGLMDQVPDGWRGVLAPLDTRSGDGRIIADTGTLRVREAPRALLWQPALADEHGGAVQVGRIDRVWIEDGKIMGEGPFDLGEVEGARAARQLGQGFSNTVSLDLDDVEMEYQIRTPDDEVVDPSTITSEEEAAALWESGAREFAVMTDWRVMTATLVPQSAFTEARLEPVYGYVPHEDADLPAGTAPPEATTEAGDDEPAEALAASAGGDLALPVAPVETPWDADAATARIFARFTDEETGEVDTGAVAAAYLWNDPEGDPATPEAYSLGFADWITEGDQESADDGNAGALMIVPAALEPLADYVGNGLDESTAEEDVTALRAGVCGLYATVREAVQDWPECPLSDAPAEAGDGEGMAAAARPLLDRHALREATGRPVPKIKTSTRAGRAAAKAARTAVNRHAGRRPAPGRPPARSSATTRMTIVAAAPILYRAADFTDPKLTEPTPLTVLDDGRIFGHLAIWGTCHRGLPGCVTPPPSYTNYSHFHLGTIDTDEGPLAAGKITLDAGHAPLSARAQAAIAHYDNTATTVAMARAGEDAHGIWVAGHTVPGITPERLAALKASPLSGDWRQAGGNLELMAALCVNMPGFAVVHPALAASGGVQTALVAAGIVRRKAEPKPKGKAKVEALSPAEYAREVIREQTAIRHRQAEADAIAARLGFDEVTAMNRLVERIGLGMVEDATVPG